MRNNLDRTRHAASAGAAAAHARAALVPHDFPSLCQRVQLGQRGQRGFTLIELVVVLTILAVLAAVALPRYMNLQRDARVGHLEGIRGAIVSGATLAHAAMLVRKNLADPWPCPANPSINADNQSVGAGTVCTEAGVLHTMNGYPASTAIGTAGIVSAAGLGTGFNPTVADLANDGYTVVVSGAGTTIERVDAAVPAACSFTYTEPPTALTAATVSASVTSGC